MTDLVAYYNKFNEEKRLQSRHGQVEYHTTMHYIHRYLELLEREREADVELGQAASGHVENRQTEPLKIIDIGAGTGRYSVALAAEGYDVTAVELVKYNLGILF